MTTQIHFILDKSGSMESCRADTIGGFNSFVRRQRELNADNCIMSLYQFDNLYEVIYKNKNIKEVPELSYESFQPNGMTALLDAIGITINNIVQNNDNIIVVILTDGEENSSENFRKNQINDLIKAKKDSGWEIVFLGANQDAIKEAENLGIGGQSALTYSAEGHGTSNAFACLSDAISRSRSTPMAKIAFTPEERVKSLSKQ